MSCRMGPNAEFKQGAFEGQPLRSFEEANFSPDQGKHRLQNSSHMVSLHNVYFIFMIVHLCVGVL
jgi:hypothetical protein